jgi:prophage regulatory protein
MSVKAKEDLAVGTNRQLRSRHHRELTMSGTLYHSDRQVAERLGVARETIWRWRDKGNLPRLYKLAPNTTRRRLSGFEEWEATL